MSEDAQTARDRAGLEGLIRHLREHPDLAHELWKALDPGRREPAKQRVVVQAVHNGEVMEESEPPLQVKMDGDRAVVIFARFVIGPLDPWVSTAMRLLTVQMEHDKPITIDMTGCMSMTGDWARWLNVLCGYDRIEVLVTEESAHRQAFEGRKLEQLLSKLR